LKKREKMNPDAVKVVYSLQLEINRLKEGYELLTAEGKRNADKQINTIESIINPIRKKMVYFSEASARDNISVLGEEYIDSQKEDLEPDEFDVAIDNEDPKNTRTGFYPTLTEVHVYSSITDININKPLIIAPDYQAAISPILSAQYDLLTWEKEPTLNMIRGIFTKQPQSLTDAVALWSAAFAFMIDRTVYYVYDHTAIGRNPQQMPYYKLVIGELRKHRWNVVEINLGKAPDHDVKYEIIKDLYDESKPLSMPRIRWNKIGCADALEAIKLTKTRVVSGLTKKDKRHEDTTKYPRFPQEHATHFTDCHDMILWATHHLKMIPLTLGGSSFGSMIGGRR
jgi:FtsZ-binding cell division protein ZapB